VNALVATRRKAPATATTTQEMKRGMTLLRSKVVGANPAANISEDLREDAVTQILALGPAVRVPRPGSPRRYDRRDRREQQKGKEICAT
jgi:hypothetical protein